MINIRFNQRGKFSGYPRILPPPVSSPYQLVLCSALLQFSQRKRFDPPGYMCGGLLATRRAYNLQYFLTLLRTLKTLPKSHMLNNLAVVAPVEV